ncbi:metallophosphoesterase family protein [Mangrovihabitans endophyticus]|uniref:Membrane protein n=1 Tax=Mangrovihabitans endophyticus TaxID=1751298 RepID=A0A8J3C259_9ACTN|nr:metallophosphoesterase [Mangrovihabitans endophyticus]GGK98810.1 membrane protein [Mangrovihabitans endophyticus]
MRRQWKRAVAVTRRGLRNRWFRRVRIVAAVLAVSLTGVVVGTLLFAHTEINVGPFRAEMSVTPSWSGSTEIDIPPLGSLHLNSHDGPTHLSVDLGSLDQKRTEALIGDPRSLTSAGQTALEEVRSGVLRLGIRALGASVACALVLAGLVFRSVRRMAWAGGVALTVTAGSLGLAAATIRPDSISEPRYEGLLVNAPAVVGDAQRIADNYGKYAAQLQQILTNVSRVYSAVSTLPVYEPAGDTTRILHVSDLHLNPSSWGLIRTVVQQFDVDAVIDTGDIVDWGSGPEKSYVSEISSVGVPYIYVRGNHDSVATEAAVAQQSNARVLNDTITQINGLTIAGIADPQFTPDKSSLPDADPADPSSSPLLRSGMELANTIRNSSKPVDVALVHDPAMAPPLAGVVPLVLAGHLHHRVVSVLSPQPAEPVPSADASPEPAGVPNPEPAPSAQTPNPPVQTRLMVEGSTGGAGLRGLEHEEPTPLALSVLYFDEQHVLKAYDDIHLGGTGQSQVTLERKVVGHDEDDEPDTTVSVPASGTPSGS